MTAQRGGRLDERVVHHRRRYVLEALAVRAVWSRLLRHCDFPSRYPSCPTVVSPSVEHRYAAGPPPGSAGDAAEGHHPNRVVGDLVKAPDVVDVQPLDQAAAPMDAFFRLGVAGERVHDRHHLPGLDPVVRDEVLEPGQVAPPEIKGS